MFIDSHSHVYFKKHFPDVDKVLERAEDAGVKKQVLVGCSVKDSLKALDFVNNYPGRGLFCTLAVHPHNANEWDESVKQQYSLLIKENVTKIVAIGEIGLDYNRNFQPEEVQKSAFKLQLEFARELGLPVVVHERDAWDDTMEILEEVGNKNVVLHSFNRGMKEAQQVWDRGYITSFSGMITYPKNDHLREVVAQVSDDKFFIETDCPYLPPQIYRGKRNEPAYVVEVAREIAKVRKTDLEKVAKLATDNTMRFFGGLGV